MKVITITMNSYQVVTEDEVVPSILASDSHRGGGLAIVISESDRREQYGNYSAKIDSDGV